MTIKPFLRPSLASIFLGAAASLFAPPSAEGTVIPAQHDALVSALATTTNYGHYADLVVIGATNSNRWSFLQFDVTPGTFLPAGTTGAHVSRAVIYLYANRVDANGSINAYKVSTQWFEGTANGAVQSGVITYGNPPTIGALQGAFSVTTDDEAEYVPIDVTNLVKDWIDNGGNNGLVLKPNGTAIVAYFDSKENGASSHAPFMEVTLSPQNTSLAAISAGTWTGANSISTLGTVTSGTWNGSTISIASGGTGATTASNARSNLGLIIGTNVQAYSGNTTLLGNSTTGTGNIVLATSPSLASPSLGTATATSLNGLTITTSTGTLTVGNGKTASISNTLTFTGTDGTSFAFPGTSSTVATLNASNAFVGANTISTSASQPLALSRANTGNILTLSGNGNIVMTLSDTGFNLSAPLTLGGGATATEFRLLEPSGGGTHYTGFKAPDLGDADVVYTLPTNDGAQGDVLVTNGSKQLAWATPNTTFTAPVLGNATATTLNGLAITSGTGSSLNIGTGGSVGVGSGKSLTVGSSLTFTGTDGTSFAFPSASGTVVTTDATQTLTNKIINGDNNTLTVKENNLVFSDSTLGNATSGSHGLLPRLEGGPNDILNAYGHFVRLSPDLDVAYVRNRDLTFMPPFGNSDHTYTTAQAAYEASGGAINVNGNVSDCRIDIQLPDSLDDLDDTVDYVAAAPYSVHGAALRIGENFKGTITIRGHQNYFGLTPSLVIIGPRSGFGTNFTIRDAGHKSVRLYLDLNCETPAGPFVQQTGRPGGTVRVYDCFVAGAFANGANGPDAGYAGYIPLSDQYGLRGGGGGTGGNLTFVNCLLEGVCIANGGIGGSGLSPAESMGRSGDGGAGGTITYEQCTFKAGFRDFALGGSKGPNSIPDGPPVYDGTGGTISRLLSTFENPADISWATDLSRVAGNGSGGIRNAGWAGKNEPVGNVVGTSDTQTLTGKTINGTNNVITNADASKLLGRPLSATTPTNGQLLVWDGSAWKPGSASLGTVGDEGLTFTPTGATQTRTTLGAQASDPDLDDLADGELSGSKVGGGINANNISTGTLALGQGGTGQTSAINAFDALAAKGSAIAINGSGVADLSMATGIFVEVTGAGTLSSLGSVAAGIRRWILFTQAGTIVHNGTSLKLPGAADVVRAAGDCALFESMGSGNWRTLVYQKSSGEAVVGGGTGGGTNATALRGRNITTDIPNTGEALVWDGSNWKPSTVSVGSVGDAGLTFTATGAAQTRTNLGAQAANSYLDDLADGQLSGARVGSGIDASNISTGTLSVNRGGTGQTTEVAAFDALGAKGNAIAINGSGVADLSAATGSFVEVTGTGTLSSLGSVAAGTRRWILFTQAGTIAHNATNLKLPGSANIARAPGDCAIFESLGAGNWRSLFYQKANGEAVIATGGSGGNGNATKLQNNNISANTPTKGQALVWAESSPGVIEWMPNTAFGMETVSTGAAQTVVGAYNNLTSGQTDGVFIVGNGTSANRKNAMRVLMDGTILIQKSGDLPMTGFASGPQP